MRNTSGTNHLTTRKAILPLARIGITIIFDYLSTLIPLLMQFTDNLVEKCRTKRCERSKCELVQFRKIKKLISFYFCETITLFLSQIIFLSTTIACSSICVNIINHCGTKSKLTIQMNNLSKRDKSFLDMSSKDSIKDN